MALRSFPSCQEGIADGDGVQLPHSFPNNGFPL
jgi:hypothetical protein